jgi:hypothetical protein
MTKSEFANDEAGPNEIRRSEWSKLTSAATWFIGGGKDGVADGIRTRNNKLHKLGLYH